MKKKTSRSKLTLSRETVRRLSDSSLLEVQGGISKLETDCTLCETVLCDNTRTCPLSAGGVYCA